MTASLQPWNDPLNSSSVDDIEEGLLDETCDTTQKFQETSTAFPRTTEHGWNELVSDPSLGEVDFSERSRAQEQDAKVTVGRKDWDHYLSAFSLNDEDSAKFLALELHPEQGDGFGVSTRADLGEGQERNFSKGSTFGGADVMGGVDSAVLTKLSDFTATKNSLRGKEGENQDAIIHGSSSRNSSHASEGSSFLARGTDIKQSSAPNAVFTSPKNLPLDSDMFMKVGGGGQTSHRQARSALDSHNAFTYFPKRSSFTPRATSAPLWQGQDTNAVITSTDFQTGKAPGHVNDVDELREERGTKMNDWESSLEQRKISGADEDTCDIPGSACITRNPSGEGIKDGSLKRDFTTYSTSKPSFSRQGTDAGETAGEITTTSIEDFSHPSGDGKRSEDVLKGSFASKSYSKVAGKESEIEWLSEDSDRHSIVGSGSEVGDAIEERDSGLLDNLKTNPPSSDNPQTLNPKRLEHTESFTETPNVATSREAAENLPIRPLTIGDSLNIGSTVTYRPVSPFLAETYPPGVTSYDPGVPSTTSATTTHLSASQYSEGALDAEEGGGDMSARERLQPLGRDGLEVKQGPPWGITMPLFQPSSRDSSLSSNDSNASASQFYQLQVTSPQHSKQEIDPLLSRSSTPSEPDLSRKASMKSLEPKEPMGVKMMPGVDNLKTPIGKFHQLHAVDGDSPVSKILGPTFKATQKMLEELQRKPLGAYDEDLDQPSVERTEGADKYESETPVDRETLAVGKRSDSERDVGQENDKQEEGIQNVGSGYLQDKRSSQNRRSSDGGRSSREKVEKPSRDSYHEDSIKLRTLDSTLVTTAASGVLSSRRVSGMDDVEKPRNSRPSSRENEVEKSSRNSSRGIPIIRGTSDITLPTTTSPRATSDTRTPDASDSRKAQNSRPSSRENEKESTRDSYYGSLINQPTVEVPSTTTPQTGIVDNTRSSEANDVQRPQSGRPSSRWNENKLDTTILNMDVENVARSSSTDVFQSIRDSGHSSSGRKVQKPSRAAVRQFSKDQNSLGSTRIPSQSHSSPIVSLQDDTPGRLANDVVGSQSRRNESHKTSGMTDSTLGNSVLLSAHLVATGVKPDHEGSVREIGRPEIFQSQNLLEDRNDASDLSEFDRVASEGISWSNALANQFRAEMRSADLDLEERLLGPGDEQAFEKLAAASSRQDSGLSESSTNDEIYRPKRLARLSAGNGLIGVYDVRQSSGPGSTNRKRLALGKKPRESSTSWLNDGIYVSDGTAGTSGTDRDNQEKSHQSRQRVLSDTYVSEGTASGTERVDNGVDSGPEEQSTPKTNDFSYEESSKPATDAYFGLTSFQPKIPTNEGRSSFTTYDIEKPPQQSLSAFMNYRKDTGQSPFSTFDIDKPTRANPPGTSRNESVTRGGAEYGGKASVAPKKAAKVECTWSISKPVMSQLITRAAPSTTRDHGEELRTSKIRQQEHRPPASKQRPSQQPESRRNRAIRQKEASRQHEKDRLSPSMGSEKIQERRGASEGRTKSVADIILENMIQDEEEQKKRHRKLGMKQEQTTQDLNHLWERFQDVFGKKSRALRDTKRAVRARPLREATPSDISPLSSSDVSSGGKRSISRQSLEITTDTDEEFERFLHRIREIQSSESSYAEDIRSISSRASSSYQHFTRDQHEATPSDRLPGKPRPKTVDSSTSLTSSATLDDERARRNEARTPTYERPSRKADRHNIHGPAAVPSSVANAKSISPASMIPMWLSAKNKEMTKMGKTSTSTCTCGAKSKKEIHPPKSTGVRDIGVNCPTPPIEEQDMRLPVAADIAVLRAGPSEEDVPRSAPASLVRLSLQDAFAISKQEFIERSRERVKKVNRRRDDRKNEKTNGVKVIVVVPSERNRQTIAVSKPEEEGMREMKSNKRFEQLQRKKPRPMTTKDIRDVNKRVYKNLPEVRKKRDEERRAEFYKTNRLRAQLYGKHVRNTNRIFTAV